MRYTNLDTSTAVFNSFSTYQENTHIDVHNCYHAYQMICIDIYVVDGLITCLSFEIMLKPHINYHKILWSVRLLSHHK